MGQESHPFPGLQSGISDGIASAVRRALAWIAGSVDQFDPSLSDHRSGVRQIDMRRMKPFVELSLVITSYVGTTGDASGSDIGRVIDLLKSALDRLSFVDWLVRYPQTLVQYLHLYIAYRIAIGENPGLRSLILQAQARGFEEHVERAPHRLMEARMCLDWADLDHSSMPSWHSLLDRSILATRISPLHIRQDALYALTHVAMFATRYGFDALKGLEQSQIEQVRPVLSDLLVVLCQDSNWDLLGEMLLSWDCLGLPSSRVEQGAWDAFLRVQEEDGSFPPLARAAASQNDENRSTEADGEDPIRLNFRRRYHTTVIAVVAGCTHLRRAGASNLLLQAFD